MKDYDKVISLLEEIAKKQKEISEIQIDIEFLFRKTDDFYLSTDYKSFIKSLELDTRTKNCLLNIFYEKDDKKFEDFLKEVIKRDEYMECYLLRIPNFGRRSLEDFKKAIFRRTGKDMERWFNEYKRIYK